MASPATIANPRQLPNCPAPTAMQPTSPVEQSGWQAAALHLKELGISKYRLESADRKTRRSFSRVALIPSPDNPRIARGFEAEADNPLEAVQTVLDQIDEWRSRDIRRSLPGASSRRKPMTSTLRRCTPCRRGRAPFPQSKCGQARLPEESRGDWSGAFQVGPLRTTGHSPGIVWHWLPADRLFRAGVRVLSSLAVACRRTPKTGCPSKRFCSSPTRRFLHDD